MRRYLLIAALVAAMVIDGFFALVNFYPVAPPRARGPRRYVLAEMEPAQAAWFQRNVLDEFNAAHDSDVQLRVVEDEAMADALDRSRRGSREVIAAVAPLDLAMRARAASAVRPFDEVVPPARIDADLAALRREVRDGARIDGRQWFLPRSTVLDVAAYRISRVRDAEEHWTLVRPQIDAALRAANGRGLPAGFQLDQSPALWDQYDLFVLGFYWAHRSYDGQPARPRIAHRTGGSVDAQIDIAAAIYRAGGTDETFRAIDAPPAVDYFAWEAMCRQHGLYAPEMFDEDGLDDEGMLEVFGRGDVFFTSFDQVEAFTLHGGSHRGASAGMREADDVGFVAVPRGASLELDPRGHPAREARGFSFRERSVWMLPAGGRDATLAYELVAWTYDRENHTRECEALGLPPLREDVIRERASVFRLEWMSDVIDAAFAQWPRSEPVPTALMAQLGPRYAALWSRAIGAGALAPTPREAIAAALRAPVAPLPAGREPATPANGAAPEPAARDAGSAAANDEVAPDEDPGAWRRRVVMQFGTDAARASDAAPGTSE